MRDTHLAITGAATLVRKYCRPIAQDTTNWPDATLEGWFDTAHERLKMLLCPPFATADIEALNLDATNSDSGDDIIARLAATLIFESLPGQSGNAYENLRRDLFGGVLPDGNTTVTGLIEQLQTGAASLFSSTGTALTRTAVAYHSLETIPHRTFSKTNRDSDGSIVGNTGELDQFDKY